MNFRQEEYRFTRGIERVEGPLTFALLGLLAWLLVSTVIRFKEVQDKLKPDLAGLVATARDRAERYNENLDEKNRKNFLIRTADLDTFGDREQLGILRNRVQAAKTRLDTMVGEAGVDMPESCYEAWFLLVEFLSQEMNGYPKQWMVESFAFTSFDAKAGAQTRPDQKAHVEAKLGLTLFGDPVSSSQKWDALQRALRQRSWVLEVTESKAFEAAPTPEARTGELKILIDVPRNAPGGTP